MSVAEHILDTAGAGDVAQDMVLGMEDGKVGDMEDGMVQGIMDKDIIVGGMYCTHIIPCPHIIMGDFIPIHTTMDTMKHHPRMAQEKHFTQVVH
jgi:hypothetical protein